MGYHRTEIPRGEYGEFSKIVEEFAELRDAHEQNADILELVELSDLYGAIAGYAEKRWGIPMEKIAQMAEMTRSSFREGKRK